jgi:pimeloyl-ACP methyl ester carboxylesterase
MTRTGSVMLAIALIVAPARQLLAQDRPVVFLHGLSSDGDTWSEAANRMQSRHAIQAHTPTTGWNDRYEAQAAQVEQALGWLDASAIAIGHSNGGLVARQWSHTHPLRGIVTVDTPHFGAPIVSNLTSYLRYADALVSAIWSAINEFNYTCCDWRWILSNIVDTILNAGGVHNLSVAQLVAYVGMGVASPVLLEMNPGSPFLQDLNSAGNQSREIVSIPARVGIISVARNFYWGGPLRAAFPEHGDTLAALRDLARDVLNYYAWYLVATASFEDSQVWSLAGHLWHVSGILDSMDEWWCRVVSSPGIDTCWENDTLVPVWSQDYGAVGAIPTVIPAGPAHTEEPKQSDETLSWALTTFMGVADRVAEPPPSPPSAAPPPAPAPPATSNTLWTETGLRRGEYLTSANGRYRLEYQWDGNLVVYDETGAALWWSGTWGPPSAAWMRADGGFVIFNGYDEPVWDSGTRGPLGNWYLRLEDNGTFVIYSPDGTPVWSNN